MDRSLHLGGATRSRGDGAARTRRARFRARREECPHGICVRRRGRGKYLPGPARGNAEPPGRRTELLDSRGGALGGASLPLCHVAGRSYSAFVRCTFALSGNPFERYERKYSTSFSSSDPAAKGAAPMSSRHSRMRACSVTGTPARISGQCVAWPTAAESATPSKFFPASCRWHEAQAKLRWPMRVKYMRRPCSKRGSAAAGTRTAIFMLFESERT